MQRVAMNPNDRQMSKAYREFSRNRYQELKASSRNVRESEMIQVIIREWEAMTMAQRRRFMLEQNDPMGTPSRMHEDRVPLDIKNKSNAKTTGRKPPSEEAEERSVPDMPAEQMPTRNVEGTPMPKTKAIAKPRARSERMRDYVSFYRFQYKRIMEEHPNWSSTKVSVIIGLRWKQEKMQAMKARAAKTTKKTTMVRKASGRITFRKVMAKGGLELSTIIRKWKRLPSESKKMWERRGDPSMVTMDKTMQHMMVKLPASSESPSRELMSLMCKK